MAKDTFDKIAPEKKQKILAEASLLFAERGFSGTDVGEVAMRAGIAKGSIYNYFDNKDDLYLTVCHAALDYSRTVVWAKIDENAPVSEQLEELFRNGVLLARQKPQFVALYLNITSAGMNRFAKSLSSEVERVSAQRLKQMLRSGIERDEITSKLDVEAAAFTINSLYIMVLASLVSLHYELRFQEYFPMDEEVAEDDRFDEKVGSVLEVIKGMLEPKS